MIKSNLKNWFKKSRKNMVGGGLAKNLILQFLKLLFFLR